MATSKDLVALEHIEWPGGRIAPGDAIPNSLPDDDVKELRANGAIGTAAEYDRRVETANVERDQQQLAAQAEASGYRLVKANDGGKAADRKG